MRSIISAIFITISLTISLSASATLLGFSNCTASGGCEVTNSPPNPILSDPNDGKLVAWDEVQNFTLLSDLRVDRVFDPNASFISSTGDGDFLIEAGTIVSSHYLQWDPELTCCIFGLPFNVDPNVKATIELDSQVFAFITSDQNLFDSDASLGLPGLDYSDFVLRGLESNDTTLFSGGNTDIDWTASSPGDWTRLITAFSPGGVGGSGGGGSSGGSDGTGGSDGSGGSGDTGGTGGGNGGPVVSVSEPGTITLLAIGLFGIGAARVRRQA